MGRTIDDSIKYLTAMRKTYQADTELLSIAIETMRKYQKIVTIVSEQGMPEWSYQRVMEIASIVRGYEDGKID